MDDLQSSARWANRVLRPLTSICRRIEKHQRMLSVIASESRKQQTAQKQAAVDTEKQEDRVDNLSTSDADDNDPVWIPGRLERRRARHKYSNRGEENNGRRRNRLSLQSPEAPRTLPGCIEIATPQITGRRWQMPPSAQSQRSIDRPSFVPQPAQQQAFRELYSLHKSPWQELLDESGDPTFAGIAHNLDRVFQNFLFNTRISKTEANPLAKKEVTRGARSLMSMLARRLPVFIATEQKTQDDLDEDGDEDMCDAYFTELETFYAPHGSGWKPLREATRAQGIHLIASMIRNHWVSDGIACALIEKCQSCAPDACQSLLSTLLSTRTSYPHPTALKSPDQPSPSGDAVRLLRRYAHHGVAPPSYIFDELAKLVSRGILPPEWMATKQWTVWVTRATISFSKQDDDYVAASRLIEAVILSASDVRHATAVHSSLKAPTGPKAKSARSRDTRASSIGPWQNPHLPQSCPLQVEDALSNHVISLMAAMCGMHMSRSRASDNSERSNGTKAGHLISYIMLALQRDMDLNPLCQRPNLTPHQLLRRGCILLGTSIAQCNDALLSDDTTYKIPSTTSVDECARSIASRTDMIKEMALFVRQAFRGLKTGTETERDPVSEDVRRMIDQLSRLADTPGLSSLLGQVAAESAMIFAEATDDPEDLVWAIEAQETVVKIQTQKEPKPEEDSEQDSELEELAQSKSLFRWEESIGEWVARTPTSKPKPRPILVQKSSRPFARMLSSPGPCIPGTDDSSSSADDSLEDSISSVISSPSSVAVPLPVAPKRTFEDTDSVQFPPRKRQRPTPVIVFENEKSSAQRRSPSPNRYNSTVEPVSRREALRERRNVNMRMSPAKQGNKVEVVVVNNRETRTRQDTTRPALERGERQIHRTMQRQRPARSPSPSPAMPKIGGRRISQFVIPWSQEEESDDELSFL
ncbi:hypothetical protein PENANT_c002G09835 [Penicillium antarcticum]|uniref:Uncharacterized protein n=1 Tax=Penicillium antarcticum TaxID=416450 RepID=A0A1V6QJM6_9EURO|nr:uncharacterized protein N7508_008615 [Penicillium antarcticum]KAJ5293794.1 hypothetical protein N7508_008615 [Penicillium antarcticum]OQD89449.1 hypothetical protein PENANT_c002G09835 [Penicillium antarcticum]